MQLYPDSPGGILTDVPSIEVFGMRLQTPMTREEWAEADVDIVLCVHDAKYGMQGASASDHALWAKVAVILEGLGYGTPDSLGWKAHF